MSIAGLSRNRFIMGFMALGVVAAGLAGGEVAKAQENEVPISPITLVDEVTGADATTDTAAQWDIGATDLGVMWDDGDGNVLMAFGDTFAQPGADGAGFDNWRSNVLLRSSDTDLSDGMTFDWALTDESGNAKEIIGSQKNPGVEHTTIPTGAISIDGRQYMAYMSVREWGGPGEWWTNFSQLAHSDDGGQTWTTEGAPRWDNNEASSDPFQMVAFVEHGDHVYMFGTPNGRFDAASLARVPRDQMLDKDAYRYFDGSDYVADYAAAAPILPAAVAEMSVRYDESTDLWQAIYLNGNADLVLRVSETPEGPWQDEQLLATQAEYPGLYGGYMHPWSPEGEIYFAMSIWNQYNVALMHVNLDDDGQILRPNLLVDPSFERSEALDVPEGWRPQGSGGIDTNQAWAKVGRRQFWVRSNSGTHVMTQQVGVVPGVTYRLVGWLKTGDSVGGRAGEGLFGVREIGPGAQVLAQETFGDLDGWTRFEVEFTTSTQTTVEVFAGSSMTGDRWVQGDDFSLVALTEPTVQPEPSPSVRPSNPPSSGAPGPGVSRPGLPSTGG